MLNRPALVALIIFLSVGVAWAEYSESNQRSETEVQGTFDGHGWPGPS